MENLLSRRRLLAGGAAVAAGACASAGAFVAFPADAPAARAFERDQRFASAAREAGARLAAHREAIGAPAISCAVAINGKIAWAEAAGWADLAQQRPATPATRFRIGSTSKALTATTTGRLLDRGLVDLDAPISTWRQDLPEKWRPLTLRQLHSHTAGIPGYENNGDLMGALSSLRRRKHYDDVADSLDQFDGAGLIYPPGEKFYYSSFDVVLASVVLQDAARKPFLDLVQSEVLDVAGMAATSADYADRNIPERATFYELADGGARPSPFVDLSGRYAAGGMLSTSSDLVRLGIAYLHGGLLSPKTIETLWTPQRLKSGEVNEQSYALGWRVNPYASEKVAGARVVHHGGVSTGAMSWLAIYPEIDVVIAMNINTEAKAFEDFNRPAGDIVKLFAAA